VGVSVLVFNTKTNEKKGFSNQTGAGKFLGVTRQAVYNAIIRNSLNGKFSITRINK
jgi:hypothetical protein